MSSKEKDEAISTITEIAEELKTIQSIRAIALYGDIEEERASETINGIIAMYYSGLSDENEESEELNFFISTHGGDTEEMFAIYDTMRMFRDKMPIVTIGLGKVMSAGILLLAAGEKGKRKVGENCRFMLHAVTGRTSSGSIHRINNDMNEFKWTQGRYVELLSLESNLTKPQIKRIMSKKLNTYFDANKALEYGIIDEII